MMGHSVIQPKENGLEKPSPAVIKVIGCGGGGSSAVNRMIEADVKNVEFIVINTDRQALNNSISPVRIPIGQQLTGGLGAGGFPEVGKKAAEEDREAIKNALSGADMVFVTAGMGGGTGTGSAPIVASIAKELGALTVGIVTTPFDFEGPLRMQYALEGVDNLKQYVDSLIIVPNTKLQKQKDQKLTFKNAFKLADEILEHGIRGVVSIIMDNGLVNTDFADVKATMSSSGEAILGIGVGTGPERAIQAATNAINNPLLEDININGAKAFLINIVSKEIMLDEVSQISKLITSSAAPGYQTYLGYVEKEDMPEDEIRVTVIATGFSSESADNGLQSQTSSFGGASDNDSIVSLGEFDNLLSGSFVSPKDFGHQPVSKVNADRNGSSLGDDIKAAANTTCSNGLVPPAGFTPGNDQETPACWRKYKGNLSNTINLRDN